VPTVPRKSTTYGTVPTVLLALAMGGAVMWLVSPASWETFLKLREEALLHEKEAVEEFLSDRKGRAT